MLSERRRLPMAQIENTIINAETAKKYCSQRRDECLKNVFNTPITLQEDSKKVNSSLEQFLTIGEGENTLNILELSLYEDATLKETGFENPLKKPLNELFDEDTSQQKAFQQKNYRSWLQGNSHTYATSVDELKHNRDRLLENLDKNYQKFEKALDNITSLEEATDQKSLSQRLGLELTKEQFEEFQKKCESAKDESAANSPLKKAIDTAKTHLEKTKEKEAHEIKRLYQQRLNNLKKIMNETDTMLAFASKQRTIARMDRRLLKGDETDEDIRRRCDINFKDSTEIQYRSMMMELEQEKRQKQGNITLPGAKKNTLVTFYWEYNEHQNTYHFTCNLNNLTSTRDKKSAVSTLVFIAVSRGATWIDISGIGDSAFLSSGSTGSLADTQGGIKGFFSNSGMKKKLELMSVAVEEAAFFGIKAENIRGVIVQQHPKLMEAYNAGRKRRMLKHQGNGTFSADSNRMTAIKLGQYDEIQGSFFETAWNNGFKDHIENRLQSSDENTLSKELMGLKTIIDNSDTPESVQIQVSNNGVLTNILQKELDNFVENYKQRSETIDFPKNTLFTLRSEAFEDWEKKQLRTGMEELQQRYEFWQKDHKERIKKIDRTITAVEPRIENRNKNTKDPSPPDQGNDDIKNISSAKDDNQNDEIKEERSNSSSLG